MESGAPFRLIDALIKHDVPFVIVGGHAVTYHGYVRATGIRRPHRRQPHSLPISAGFE